MPFRPPVAPSRERTFRYRGGTARVGCFRGRVDTGHLIVAGLAPPIDVVHKALRDLRSQGYDAVVTAPVTVGHADVLESVGFRTFAALDLLSAPMSRTPRTPTSQVRRARHRDRDAVVAVDAAAFTGFWRIGARGIADALRATPRARLMVAGPEREVRGYAIFASAGGAGFVQRLAVDPTHQGQGLGSALMLNGLEWLRRQRVRQAYVNTQEGNAVARRLYEACGFRRHSSGLWILYRSLRTRSDHIVRAESPAPDSW